MAQRPLRLGTRGSALARRQAAIVVEALQRVAPEITCEIVTLRTEGDDAPTADLASFGGQGVFVRRIERVLLSGAIDVAVHSFKDMPSASAEGLAIAAFLPRDDPRDALFSAGRLRLADLPPGARVGTGSPRRRALLLEARPDVQVVPIRGNVDTRVRRVESGELQAVVLAAAGLARLGRAADIAELLDPTVFVPAIGQGILAVQVPASDSYVARLVSKLDDAETRACAAAERAAAREVGAGCQAPVGAYARGSQGRLEVFACALAGGSWVCRAHRRGDVSRADDLGAEVGRALLRAVETAGSAGSQVTAVAEGKRADPNPLPEGEGAGSDSPRPLGEAGRSPQRRARPSEGNPRGPALTPTLSQRERVQLPLAGKCVLITRPQGQAERLAEALAAEGAEPLLVPVIQIGPPESWEAADAAIARGGYDWVVFTSANGVRFFWQRLEAGAASLNWFRGTKVAAIGPETARSLEARGVAADLVPDEYVAEALVAALTDAGPLASRRVLLPRAEVVRDALEQGLAAAGASIDKITVYRTVPASAPPGLVDRLRSGQIDVVTFTSGSTVHALLLMLGPDTDSLQGTIVACIGPVTAAAARDAGLSPQVIATTYTVPGLVAALRSYFDGAAGPAGGERTPSHG